jgi:hypothetical protein
VLLASALKMFNVSNSAIGIGRSRYGEEVELFRHLCWSQHWQLVYAPPCMHGSAIE